ncbi:f1f0 atp synthase assembly protein [Colletotrichum truncatum]|uniref:F1f0 atp synthase assembly protein n=1 Tax=Colletotrichum truncatum TaxID=5467 RepID=A0ACC3Z5A9_COLTU|nr:f1f0 atp synthase assembly protein [Colletotrichum truncatum]KAF6795153.1 f1f0 atp synthase assembly protein [Colletotrichum truncatum]
MASCRIPALRHLVTSSARAFRASNQRRWAQVHDVRFLATTQQPRAVIEKYRAKLDQKAREQGLSNIDELKAVYADKIQDQKKKDAISVPGLDDLLNDEPAPTNPSTATASPDATAAQKQAPVPGSSGNGVKSLDEILDLPKARELPDKELTAIWRLRHASDPSSLCAVIPASTYRSMEALAKQNPQFILPVPHESQGAEIHFLQWVFDPASKTATAMFTQLAEFKARGEYAQPHTTVTHHTDLADDRGLVLMHGKVSEDRGVKTEHAQWLVMCLQRFYGEAEGKERAAERKKLLEWFRTGDERFSVEKLMEEAERIG